MTKQKTTKRALIISALAMLLSVTMLVGTTFAWFTDSVVSGNNVITSGNLDIEVEYTLDGTTWNPLNDATNLFQKDLWEPGHTELVALKIMNKGSLAAKYAVYMNLVGETVGKNKEGGDIKLSEILRVKTAYNEVNQMGDILLNMAFAGGSNTGESVAFKDAGVLKEDVAIQPGDAHYLIIEVDMPETVGNEASHNGINVPAIKFGVNVLATQYGYESDTFGTGYDKDAEYVFPVKSDVWEGTADISWYLENPNATEYTLSTAEALAGLATLIDGSASIPAAMANEITLPVSFDGKTVYLDADVDLYAEGANGEPICFEPIGSYKNDQAFSGTFDGQGHTIKNMNQNTWALDNGYYYSDCGMGMFGALSKAHIKNLKIDNAAISGEYGLVGVVAAYCEDTTFENITVSNSKAADYEYYAGGIVGWASGDCKFIGCTVDASTTIGGQWGDFNNASGGVIGGASSSAQIYMKDCTVACRIDAFNDVTSAYQWGAYRNSGMLIGTTGETVEINGTIYAAAPQLTCENVNVIYGDWANYTYCEFSAERYPYVRVQAGTSTGAYSNPRYGNPTDAEGNKVTNDTHAHNPGEDHNELLAFDQLYGGYCGAREYAYGTATHEGVTVTYNNK